jgi:hypothetical protein
MRSPCCILITWLGFSGAALAGGCTPDTAPATFYLRHAPQEVREVRACFPPAFVRDRGVSWDGRIGWKTEERVWVFAAALEGSLKPIVRADSPYRLSVAVVRVEKRTGTFVVEFSIQDPSGEPVEQVQVEGVGPGNRALEEVYPAVAGEIVATFQKSVLQ